MKRGARSIGRGPSTPTPFKTTAWLRRVLNLPEDVVDELMDGLVKAGLPAFAPTT